MLNSIGVRQNAANRKTIEGVGHQETSAVKAIA